MAQPLEDADYFVSVITEIELLSYQRLTPEEEARIKGFLDDVVVVRLTSGVKTRTITVRREHGLKLPDAIIAASAMDIGATLLSNDTRFAGLPDLAVESRVVQSRI